jgi:alkylation response protein AidB-like acyl-CoA dehydrogenase
MDLLPSADQDEIVATVRSQLDAGFDPSDRALWRRCAELGWFGLGLDESLGGVGFGLAEEALLFAELGAHATPGPFLPTVLGARVAAEAGESELAAQVLSGEAVVALAEPHVTGRADDAGAVRIVDGPGADLLLHLTHDRVALVDAAAVDAVGIPSIDTLVPVSIAHDVGRATVRAEASDPAALRARGTVLIAAELAGIATATAEQSTQYAKDREQFGVPIGSFQAVKHRCADMAVRAEAATASVRYAALALADGRPDATFAVHAARSVAGDAAVANARVNVQNHGGIGFTWEHTAHRFVTRAEVRSRTLGDRGTHLAALLAAPSGR